MNLDCLIDSECSVLDAAEQVTEHQLRLAKQIVASANAEMKTNLPVETVGGCIASPFDKLRCLDIRKAPIR